MSLFDSFNTVNHVFVVVAFFTVLTHGTWGEKVVEIKKWRDFCENGRNIRGKFFIGDMD